MEMGQPRTTRHLLCWLPLALLAVHAGAFADMRCNTGLVSEGDSTVQVERQCGAPANRQVIPAAQGSHSNKRGNAVNVENWVYGPRNGAYYSLKFLDGKLVSIDVSRE